MNMSWQGFSMAMPKTPLLPSVTLLALFLSGCSMYMGDHKVVVSHETPNALHNESSGSQVRNKFPDPVLRDNLFEAKEISESIYDEGDVHRLSSGVHICFPKLEKC